jgi:hypothetical protein
MVKTDLFFHSIHMPIYSGDYFTNAISGTQDRQSTSRAVASVSSSIVLARKGKGHSNQPCPYAIWVLLGLPDARQVAVLPAVRSPPFQKNPPPNQRRRRVSAARARINLPASPQIQPLFFPLLSASPRLRAKQGKTAAARGVCKLGF